MQTCRISKRRLSFVLFFCLGLVFQYNLAAESSSTDTTEITSLSMPTITTPSMPTISVPSLQDNSTATEGTTTTTTTNSNTTSETGTTTENTEIKKITDSGNVSNIQLTAEDIKTLSNMGSLNSENISDSLSNSTLSPDSLLKSLLSKLTALKTDQKDKLTEIEKKQDAQTTSKPIENNSILRFTINGYDISGSCTTLYFSKTAADGSFLFTGDRKYISSGKTITETFYLLFTSQGNSGGVISYVVTPTLFQQWTNPYSFFYRLEHKKNLTAQKTGNLVTLHVTDNDLKVDLLLKMGN